METVKLSLLPIGMIFGRFGSPVGVVAGLMVLLPLHGESPPTLLDICSKFKVDIFNGFEDVSIVECFSLFFGINVLSDCVISL
jgi:hypothetical protein